jgi:hypothetical protein
MCEPKSSENATSERFAADQNDDELTLLFSLLSDHTAIRYGTLISFTRLQRIWLSLAGGFFVVAVILAVTARFVAPPVNGHLVTLSLILVLTTQLLACAFMITAIFPSIRSMLQPTRSFLREEEHYTKKDFYLSQQMCEIPERLLRFTAIKLHSQADQMRSRIGVLTGALDKIGLIPLAGSVGLTIWKLREQVRAGQFPIWSPVLYILVGGVVGSYLGGIVGTTISHRLDENGANNLLKRRLDRSILFLIAVHQPRQQFNPIPSE